MHPPVACDRLDIVEDVELGDLWNNDGSLSFCGFANGHELHIQILSLLIALGKVCLLFGSVATAALVPEPTSEVVVAWLAMFGAYSAASANAATCCCPVSYCPRTRHEYHRDMRCDGRWDSRGETSVN